MIQFNIVSVFFLILFVFLFNLIFFLKFNSISNFLALFDKPDGKLKRHSKPISLIGGLVIITNVYLIIFLLGFFNIYPIFESQFLFSIIILSTLFYLIGLIDDLKNLTPNIKLLLLLFSISSVSKPLNKIISYNCSQYLSCDENGHSRRGNPRKSIGELSGNSHSWVCKAC